MAGKDAANAAAFFRDRAFVFRPLPPGCHRGPPHPSIGDNNALRDRRFLAEYRAAPGEIRNLDRPQHGSHVWNPPTAAPRLRTSETRKAVRSLPVDRQTRSCRIPCASGKCDAERFRSSADRSITSTTCRRGCWYSWRDGPRFFPRDSAIFVPRSRQRNVAVANPLGKAQCFVRQALTIVGVHHEGICPRASRVSAVTSAGRDAPGCPSLSPPTNSAKGICGTASIHRAVCRIGIPRGRPFSILEPLVHSVRTDGKRRSNMEKISPFVVRVGCSKDPLRCARARSSAALVFSRSERSSDSGRVSLFGRKEEHRERRCYRHCKALASVGNAAVRTGSTGSRSEGVGNHGFPGCLPP